MASLSHHRRRVRNPCKTTRPVPKELKYSLTTDGTVQTTKSVYFDYNEKKCDTSTTLHAELPPNVQCVTVQKEIILPDGKIMKYPSGCEPRGPCTPKTSTQKVLEYNLNVEGKIKPTYFAYNEIQCATFSVGLTKYECLTVTHSMLFPDGKTRSILSGCELRCLDHCN